MKSCLSASISLTILLSACTTAPRTDPKAQSNIFSEPAASMILDQHAGEGPAWHPFHGLFFSGGGDITRLDLAGKVSLYRKDAGSNGLLFDHQKRLLVCDNVRRQITRTDLDGSISVLANQYGGKRFNQPNDITIDSKGRIYFSDPKYGNREGMEIQDASGKLIEGVYRIDPNESVALVIGNEVDRPNGVMVSANDKYLFVADNNNNSVGGARKLWRFDLMPSGSVDFTSQKLLFDWGRSRGPDGMAQDRLGRLYVAGGRNTPVPQFETAEPFKGGIYVFEADGTQLDFVPIPRDEVTNCSFGGPDLRTLYITAGGTLWSIRTKTPGWLPWLER
ncbi:MAG: SMP-30/gluconolactonase/LRE family protein [Verrucomicrobia bacterium]|nr:SMP-30/gluconolactonase/LRE family protein [Verrucomicrobiota bacterium]